MSKALGHEIIRTSANCDPQMSGDDTSFHLVAEYKCNLESIEVDKNKSTTIQGTYVIRNCTFKVDDIQKNFEHCIKGEYLDGTNRSIKPTKLETYKKVITLESEVCTKVFLSSLI